MQFKKMGVIGAGIMGSGIAQVMASSGFSVVIMDIQESFLKSGKEKIVASLNRSVEKGKITREETEKISSRLTWTLNLEEIIPDAEFIIEAAPENIDLKKDLFRKLDEKANQHTILASNTSSFSISALASVTKNPQRVIGMHWFNPPVAMKLIEVIQGIATAQETVQRTCELVKALGKETVVCKDSQGFIVTRALVALRLECYRILSEGLATKEDIDKALKLGLGHPMGQFELADFSGLDIEPPICEGLEKAFGERFKAPQNILNIVRAGWFGRKTAKGWYDYSAKS
jgi:3-hydroxybutyryl-CoA dehydrogenase